MIDPLHVPAECRKDDMDYQWFSVFGRDPHATGWVAVERDEMPTLPSDCPQTIDRRELRLYKRPMALTERVRKQETAVAVAQLNEAAAMQREVSREFVARRFTALPLTSPLGPHPTGRTLRGLAIYALVRLRRQWGAPDSHWLIAKFARTNALGLSRWAEENRVTLDRYVTLHTEAILEGKGRWPGQIVRAAVR